MTYISKSDPIDYFDYFQVQGIHPRFTSNTLGEFILHSIPYTTETAGKTLLNRVIDLFNLPIWLYNNVYIQLLDLMDPDSSF